MSAPRFVIFQDGPELSGVVCRPGITRVSARSVHRVRMEGSGAEALDTALSAMRRSCQAAGDADVWSGGVLLCLSADAVLFRENDFPGRSTSTAQKALALLLESELPPDAAPLRKATRFLRVKSDAGPVLRALTFLAPRTTLALWETALAKQGCSRARVTAWPWPILAGIPRGTGQALLLQVLGGRASLALLDADGRPLRLRALSGPTLHAMPNPDGRTDWTRVAAGLRREAALVAQGLAHEPERLCCCGDPAADREALAALEDAFGLQVQVPGRDFPLRGHAMRPGETDTRRLAAAVLCAADRTLPLVPPPFPSIALSLAAPARQALPGKLVPAMLGAGVLSLGVAASLAVDAERNVRQAAGLRSDLAASLVRALPDAPKGASPARLRAILNSRIRELETRGPGGVSFPTVRFLEAVHAAVPASLGVEVARLSMEERQCRLQGAANSFDEVNALREALSRLEDVSRARVVSAAARGDTRAADGRVKGGRPGVEFEIVLDRSGK